MTSNSPFTRFAWLRRLMYRALPGRPARPRGSPWCMGHAGTLLELAVPLVLLLGRGGTVTVRRARAHADAARLHHQQRADGRAARVERDDGLRRLLLFWTHAERQRARRRAPPVAVLLGGRCAWPCRSLGNLFPRRVPFLLAMRYYAGNWAYSVWLFRGDSHRKLDRLDQELAAGSTTSSAASTIARTASGIVGKVMAFRLMHLHGRALPLLVPKARRATSRTTSGSTARWSPASCSAGTSATATCTASSCCARCRRSAGSKPGELRCIFVESQPLGGRSLHYRILDAATGLIEEGNLAVEELRPRQPWGAECIPGEPAARLGVHDTA